MYSRKWFLTCVSYFDMIFAYHASLYYKSKTVSDMSEDDILERNEKEIHV